MLASIAPQTCSFDGAGCLAPLVGASLDVMSRDAKKMRGDGPFLFARAARNGGVDEVIGHVLTTWRAALGKSR